MTIAQYCRKVSEILGGHDELRAVEAFGFVALGDKIVKLKGPKYQGWRAHNNAIIRELEKEKKDGTASGTNPPAESRSGSLAGV